MCSWKYGFNTCLELVMLFKFYSIEQITVSLIVLQLSLCYKSLQLWSSLLVLDTTWTWLPDCTLGSDACTSGLSRPLQSYQNLLPVNYMLQLLLNTAWYLHLTDICENLCELFQYPSFSARGAPPPWKAFTMEASLSCLSFLTLCCLLQHATE